MGLYKGWAPELRSFPHFMLALRQQFEDPFEEEKAHARLQQIRQGSLSMSEYISEFHQLAGVVQGWPEQVKIHFFREGLHPEVAQWAMVTAEPTSLAGWYTRAAEAEVRLRPQELALSQKRDMHDFFVGLMGKRTSELDDPTEGNKGMLPDFGNLKYPYRTEDKHNVRRTSSHSDKAHFIHQSPDQSL
uniref:Uncharacterized protein n=1 Tax=Sphaerodactylus townsendi TaxID=933632 RepID=A0ACB8EM87_9SAUR